MKVSRQAPNINLFNSYVAEILANLYQHFPVRQTIRIDEFLGYSVTGDTIGPDGRWTGEYRDKEGRLVINAAADFRFVEDTIRWLGDAGYIIHAPYERGYHFNGVTLSARGLELLKAVPASVAGSRSVGDSLLAMLEEGAKDAAASTISSALTQFPLAWMLLKVSGGL